MANAQYGDGSLGLAFLLYTRSACIPLMISDTMSKTTSIMTRTQAVISLALELDAIWRLLDDWVP